MAERVRRDHAVGSNSWTRAMALSALALLTIPTFSGATAHAGSSGVAAASAGTVRATAPIAAATECADETVRWGGFQVLDAAIPSFDTGVDVVPRAGTTLTIVGVSADGLDPTDHAHVMPVTIGSVAAVPGAVVDAGGDVIVRTDGSEVLRVAGVTVVVRRCAEVASAAVAPPAIEITSAADAAVEDVAGAPITTSAMPTPEQAAAAVAMLPATGGESWVQTLLGAMLVAVGGALVTFGRRPRRTSPR